jgi:hypothetical protein
MLVFITLIFITLDTFYTLTFSNLYDLLRA